MLLEISAGLSSLKAAKDIVQGLNAAKNEAAINGIKIDLQGLILEAQQGLFAAQEAQSAGTKRIAELEQEIVRLKDWSAQKQRYELADSGRGSLAYKLKEGVEPPEPAHWICPNCYDEGKKSLLKHEILPVGRAETLVCNRCPFDVVTRGIRMDQPKGGALRRGR